MSQNMHVSLAQVPKLFSKRVMFVYTYTQRAGKTYSITHCLSFEYSFREKSFLGGFYFVSLLANEAKPFSLSNLVIAVSVLV